jgi:hypothetical protein
MAHVATPTDISARVDRYLTYLLDVVDYLPEVDAEWDTWDDIQQLDFVFEWDIKRDRLSELEHWAEQGLLTVDQRQRYRRLLELMDKRRPILDRLLAD